MCLDEHRWHLGALLSTRHEPRGAPVACGHPVFGGTPSVFVGHLAAANGQVRSAVLRSHDRRHDV